MEIPAALLSETDEAYTIALEVLDQDKRRYLAEGIETIAERITDKRILFRIDRKLDILNKVNARITRNLNNADMRGTDSRSDTGKTPTSDNALEKSKQPETESN